MFKVLNCTINDVNEILFGLVYLFWMVSQEIWDYLTNIDLSRVFGHLVKDSCLEHMMKPFCDMCYYQG